MTTPSPPATSHPAHDARTADMVRCHWQLIARRHMAALVENRPQDFKSAAALHARLLECSAVAVQYADREFPLPVSEVAA